jgi:hypothetical protein
MFEEFDEPAAWEGMAIEVPHESPDPETVPEFEDPTSPKWRVSLEPPYVDESQGIEATYVMFKKEEGMDGMYQAAQDWLEREGGMLDTFQIFPVNIQ